MSNEMFIMLVVAATVLNVVITTSNYLILQRIKKLDRKALLQNRMYGGIGPEADEEAFR